MQKTMKTMTMIRNMTPPTDAPTIRPIFESESEVFGLGLAVELPELPEFGDDDVVAVFWLTDGLVDSGGVGVGVVSGVGVVVVRGVGVGLVSGVLETVVVIILELDLKLTFS